MTENRIIYGAIFLAAVIFVSLFEHHATYTVLYAVVLLPMVSAAVLIVSKKNMTATAHLDACAVKKGEPVHYTVHISNNSFIHFHAKAVLDKRLRGFVNGKMTESLCLLSRRGGKAVFTMDFKYRGIYDVAAACIWVYDFLGIFRLRMDPPPLTLTVQPCIQHLGEWSNLPQNASSRPSEHGLSAADSSDFPDFNKYLPSEGFRRIHWGLSAKRGELISKKYKETAKPAIAVIIDNTAFSAKTSLIDAAKCEDKLIEAAVMLVHHYTAASVSVNLAYIGGAGVFSDAFEHLYALISDIRFDGRADFGDFAAECIENGGFGDVYIFAQSLTESLINAVKEGTPERDITVFHYVPAKKKAEPPQGIACCPLPESIGVTEAINQFYLGMV